MQSHITSTIPNQKDIKKTENDLADLWIRRWRRFSRQGLGSRGYPPRSAFADPVWFYDPDDEPNYLDGLVREVLDAYKGRARDILLDYYYMKLSMAEVAIKNGMSKGGVQWRIDAIRTKVVKVIKKHH